MASPAERAMADEAFPEALRIIFEELKTRESNTDDADMAGIIGRALYHGGMIVVSRSEWEVADRLVKAVRGAQE